MNRILLCLFSCLSLSGIAQNLDPLQIDAAFNAVNLPTNHHFIDLDIRKHLVGPDGKIYIVNETSLTRMVGNQLDNTFVPHVFLNGTEAAIFQDVLLQPDGKLLVGGDFNKIDGVTRYKLARFNIDGSLDTTFDAPLGTMYNYGVLKIYQQPDGKILVIGDSAINSGGNIFNNLIRLNANGTVDTSFVTPANYRWENIAIEPSGTILATHNTYNSFYSDKNKVSRLTANGAFDSSFATATFSGLTGSSANVQKIVALPDGKILVAGRFTGISGTSSSCLAKLNQNGSLDTSFSLGGEGFYATAYLYCTVNDIQVQPDGKILAGGVFTHFNGVPAKDFIRLNANGTRDTSFPELTSFANISNVTCITQLPDGKALVSGMNGYLEVENPYIVRINADGSWDPTYQNYPKGFYNQAVNSVCKTPDGKLIVAGYFWTYNGEHHQLIARLNSDGSIDNSFASGVFGFSGTSGVQPSIAAAVVDADGKIYVTGNFNRFNGANCGNMIRLNPNGSKDTSFPVSNAGTEPNFSAQGSVKVMVPHPAGGVMVGFNNQTGSSGNGLMRVFANGATINYATDYYPRVFDVKFQSDQKMLLALGYNGGSIRRFNANSFNYDPTFVVPSGISAGSASRIELQNDGKILVVGEFTIGGQSKSLVRLNADGSLDSTFTFSLPANSYVNDACVLADGKIAINLYDNAIYANKLSLLNADGSVATTSTPTVSWEARFTKLDDGSLYLRGMKMYDDRQLYGLVRLVAGDATYFLQGQNRLDSNNNGCQANDPVFPWLKYQFTAANSSDSFTYIADSSGNFNIGVTEGQYTLTPQFENPTYFSASPTATSVNFPTTQSPSQQNFCVTPVGIHPDLEVVVLPIDAARPGFSATYKIVYRNKGNQLLSGSVNFGYNDTVSDFVSSFPAGTASPGSVNWNFSALYPQEKREITINMLLNSPVQVPSLNAGSVLDYTVGISSSVADETPDDNQFTLHQTVVNSYDPNDKTCLEGNLIPIGKVGEYVHYMIRFENNGTYAAENISVHDNIDTSKFDITTLTPLTGSHTYTTRITDGNKVEFYFGAINLPYQDAVNDGYLVFKIKTLNSLTYGDNFTNSAAIFFDYNPAIATNTASTFVEQLMANPDVDKIRLTVYPNPASQKLHLKMGDLNSASSVNIYNLQGMLLLSVTNFDFSEGIDVSRLSVGSYLVEVRNSDKTFVSRFVKR
ncbi:T9SS type A sorting domain-containing protein [Flavobacterium sp.]|uniref:DUF7619 domain-containing protein n=1 Tax=Flavobacterium sp. TaxID=239 RepID=UPI001229EF31|nr:T9SS type A sorting domain-containing protein [Flavobacterium sp.]RZJ71793.1 MAG: T9SS type A sorting domain-containing protein [Flavobacterium sp.]